MQKYTLNSIENVCTANANGIANAQCEYTLTPQKCVLEQNLQLSTPKVCMCSFTLPNILCFHFLSLFSIFCDNFYDHRDVATVSKNFLPRKRPFHLALIISMQ